MGLIHPEYETNKEGVIVAFLASFFDSTKREVQRAWKTVNIINSMRPKIEALSDMELREKTIEFKQQLKSGKSLNDILPEAFAVVREASWRVLGKRQYRFWIKKIASDEGNPNINLEIVCKESEKEDLINRLKSEGRDFTIDKYMEPFDVQMICGIMLHKGMISEMKTGEGKTLVATAPLYLNALTERGVLLVTTNDFLVRYQGTMMGELFYFLGMSTGITQSGRGDGKLPAFIFNPDYVEPDGLPKMEPVSRTEAYQADITYTSNNEVGFDYLRDNMEMDIRGIRLRDLHYAIVDEVDSILVDEARTPLIISGPGQKPSENYVKVDKVIKTLKAEIDYIIDEKSKNASLTEDGLRKVERGLAVTNLTEPENLELYIHVQSAMKANACYIHDKDYIVSNGEVIIIDEFTGRQMYGRRYSEGLHQAIEAKEGVKVERESQTLATITFQNFFLLFEKLAGMTGTAKTEEQEFIKIYGLPAAVIPTHRAISRKDFPDVVYKTEEAKLRGIVGEILLCESRRQPALVGTRSIEFSERLSNRLKTDMLRAYTLASVLYRNLLELKNVTEKQKNEFMTVLKLRSQDVRKEKEHLEKSIEKLELYSNQKAMRLVQPEEIRQLETRRDRAIDLDGEIQVLIGKVQSGGNLSENEARRLAEIICFQRLEDVRTDKLAKLMEASGLPPQADNPENVAKLAEIIELTSDLDRLQTLLMKGVTHKVLNAKYHEQEAQIIAQAGRSGAITIATNMAGRGVDIMLGGNPEGIVEDVLKEWDMLPDAVTEEILEKAIQEARERCLKDRELVVSLGGLAIIGTERHESRRIDNQLRGRSGRQGDPGQSRFYVSMQDELMRLFGPERFDFLLRSWDESEPIAAKMISNRIEVAQKKVESHNFESRQHVVKYDEVMKQQRKIVYEQRRKVLEGANIKESVVNAIKLAVNKRVMKFVGDHPNKADWDTRGLATSLLEIAPMLPLFFNDESMRYGPSNQLFADAHNQKIWDNYYAVLANANSVADLNESIMNTMMEAYENHENEHSEEHMRTLERLVTLRVIDEKWINHLDAMDFLRDGIQLRAYEQTDPLQAYSKEAYTLWLELLDDMQETIAHTILRVRLMVEEEEHRKAAQRKPLATNRGADEAPKRGDRVAHSKVGQNDPCPCGSGLKFKQCCKK